MQNSERLFTGSHSLLQSLVDEGVDLIFGYPGGAIMPVYDALTDFPQIRHILVRHEQAAAFAADSYARVKGKAGVCLATSGPGATNLVTGLANAMLDSTPMVAITGQVPSYLIGTDAFQETDVIGVTLPITKHNYFVERVEDIPQIVHEAFHIATTGRPGPVLIDIPKDIQFAKTTYKKADSIDLPGFKPNLFGNPLQIKKAAELILEAKRPVIIAGHGVLLSKATHEFRKFVDLTQIPVVSTILGLGALNSAHPFSLGMLGMHGHAHSNHATHNADLILGIGIRFDDRITGRLDEFAKGAKVIHIDIDPAEIGKNVPADVPIVGDCKNVLIELNQIVKAGNYQEWLKHIEDHQGKYKSDLNEHNAKQNRDPNKLLATDVMQAISAISDEKTIIVTDVGQHQMIASQYHQFRSPDKWVTSAGLGAMGFGLPAGIGAKLAKSEDKVWIINGDGGFQMNIQELMTLKQDDIRVKIALFNNNFLGMVRQWQELFFEKNYSHVSFMNPNYELICQAYGVKYLRADSPENLQAITLEANDYNDGSVLVEYMIEAEENVFPMVPTGASLGETRYW
jgi:acetolactate synthase-1/2/3 large subunit